MSSPQVNGERWHQVGESWVRTLAERDFGRLALLCQPDVRGRLLRPGAAFLATSYWQSRPQRAARDCVSF